MTKIRISPFSYIAYFPILKVNTCFISECQRSWTTSKKLHTNHCMTIYGWSLKYDSGMNAYNSVRVLYGCAWCYMICFMCVYMLLSTILYGSVWFVWCSYVFVRFSYVFLWFSCCCAWYSYVFPWFCVFFYDSVWLMISIGFL